MLGPHNQGIAVDNICIFYCGTRDYDQGNEGNRVHRFDLSGWF